MKKQWWWGAALVLLALSAQAAGPAAVRKQVEASMLVKGTIDIEPGGAVRSFAFDRVDELPKGVVDYLDDIMKSWRFEPMQVGDGAVVTRSKFSVRIVSKKSGEDSYELWIAGTNFESPNEADWPHAAGPLKRPRYPDEAARNGVGGIVYVVLWFGRDGNVAEAVAEQVNLMVVTQEDAMDFWRKRLASAALAAARDWKFVPPAQGPEAGDSKWSLRVPVAFVGNRISRYGQWEAYVPGPRQPVPWRSAEDAAAVSPDAVADGGVYPDGARGPRLVAPLDQG